MPNQCHMLSSSVTEPRSIMTMQDQVNTSAVAHRRVLWKKWEVLDYTRVVRNSPVLGYFWKNWRRYSTLF
jgi:hypothetical protein